MYDILVLGNYIIVMPPQLGTWGISILGFPSIYPVDYSSITKYVHGCNAINQTLNSQKIPYILPAWVRYVSIAGNLVKIVIRVLQCKMHLNPGLISQDEYLVMSIIFQRQVKKCTISLTW